MSQSHKSEVLEAEDCTYKIFGRNLIPPPTVYKAFVNASRGGEIKSISNLSIEKKSFDAFFYGKECFVVKGRGGR